MYSVFHLNKPFMTIHHFIMHKNTCICNLSGRPRVTQTYILMKNASGLNEILMVNIVEVGSVSHIFVQILIDLHCRHHHFDQF